MDRFSNTYKEIKALSMFIKDFGEELCEMPAIIPEDNPIIPEDLERLRYSFRHNGMSGYVFVNNYQRRKKMKAHKSVALEVKLDKETIQFPSTDIENEAYFFYPFNMKIGNALLKSALATPLCIINEKSYIFYTDKEANYVLEGELGDYEIITLSRKEAINAWKIQLNKEHLIICEDPVIQKGKSVEILSKGKTSIKVYPDFDRIKERFVKIGDSGVFTTYEVETAIQEPMVSYELLEENEDNAVYEMKLDYVDMANDFYLIMDYQGESAKLYLEEELIGDDFYYGDTWSVSLKRFQYPSKLRLEIAVLRKEDKIFLEKWPDMEDKTMRLNKVRVMAEKVIVVN